MGFLKKFEHAFVKERLDDILPEVTSRISSNMQSTGVITIGGTKNRFRIRQAFRFIGDPAQVMFIRIRSEQGIF